MAFKISTKPDKDGAAVETHLTVDWTGAGEEVLRQIALSAIVIKWQGWARKNGIPSSATIRAVDYVPGTRLVQAPTIDQLVTKLTAEEKLALIQKLQAAE